MLKAIVEGKRDPGWMADYARGTLRGKRRDLERALEFGSAMAQTAAFDVVSVKPLGPRDRPGPQWGCTGERFERRARFKSCSCGPSM